MLVSEILTPGTKLIWEEEERIKGHAKKFFGRDDNMIVYPVIVKKTTPLNKEPTRVINFKTHKKQFTARLNTKVDQLRYPTDEELEQIEWPTFVERKSKIRYVRKRVNK